MVKHEVEGANGGPRTELQAVSFEVVDLVSDVPATLLAEIELFRVLNAVVDGLERFKMAHLEITQQLQHEAGVGALVVPVIVRVLFELLVDGLFFLGFALFMIALAY